MVKKKFFKYFSDFKTLKLFILKITKKLKKFFLPNFNFSMLVLIR